MPQKRPLSNLLDRPLFDPARINLEVLLYGFLALLAIAAAFGNLGARGQSHDECVHFIFSYELYSGDGFVYDPWRHGPFLYYANALMYTLLGTGDWSARAVPALFGVVLVLLPAFLRKELGRVGALATSALTLISPSMLYYARYLRNDIYMMVWAMGMTIALFRFLDTRRAGWLYLGAVAVTMALSTKETAYITGFIGAAFGGILILRQALSPRGVQRVAILALAAVLILILAWIGLSAYAETLPVEAPEEETSGAVQDAEAVEPAGGGLDRKQVGQAIEGLILLLGLLLTALAGGALAPSDASLGVGDASLRPALALLVGYVATIGALLVLSGGGAGAVWLGIVRPALGAIWDQVQPWLLVTLQFLSFGLGAAGGGYAWWRLYGRARARGWLPDGFQPRTLYVTLALSVGLFTVLYTTFFTNPEGLITGTVGGLRYWFSQQEVKRASQPWYYYGILIPLYEFLPLGLSLLGMALYARARIRGDGAGDGSRGALVAYLVYWALAAAFIYSWAGEKMPWMMVHIAQPLILLAGRTVDDLFRAVDWARVWRKGGVLLLLSLPLLVLSLALIVRWTVSGQVFREADVTLRWLLALAAGSGLLALTWTLWRRLGARTALHVVLTCLVLVAALFTARYSWLANFINYDTAREFLVYSHGTPDLKHTVRELKALSRRLYGDETALRFAYTEDATWPIECYLEPAFPNRVFIGSEPTRANTDELVLLVGAKEIEKVEPLLGDRYYRSDRRYLWFPHQDYYMNLSLALPKEEDRQPGVNYFWLDMQDPGKRRAFLDVVFYRRYAQSLADWEPANPGKFALYLRKDIAAQIWDREVGAVQE
jgi:uncharacterized protein (TIGR03663 family)